MSGAGPQNIREGHFINDKQGRRVLSVLEPLEIGSLILVREEGPFRVEAAVASSHINENQREFAWREGEGHGREAWYYYVEPVAGRSAARH